MERKPTYEELKQRISELQNEAFQNKRTEEASKKIQIMISDILESISDGFFTLNDELIVTYFNKAAEQLLGRKSQKVIGQKLFDSFPEAIGSIFEDKYTWAVKEKKFVSFQTYFGLKPYENWYDVRVYPFENGISVYFQVITEQKLVEDALRKSEDRYRSLVENQTELVSRFTPDGTFVFVNDVYCHFFEKTKDELIGKKWQPLPVDDDLPLIQKKLQTLSQSNSTVFIENRLLSGKGDIHWMQFVNSGLFDLHGNLLEIQSVGRDITDRKQAEEALRASEEKFSKAFHNAPLLMTITSMEDGRYLEVNDAFVRATKHSREAVVGKTSIEIGLITSEDRDRLPILLKPDGRIKELEIQMTRADGSKMICLYSGEIIEIEGKKRLLSIASDITERKRTEEALRESEERFSGMFEHASSGVAIYESVDNGKDFVFRAFNPAAERITRTSRSEVLGNRLLELFPHLDKAGLLGALQRVWKTGQKEHILPFYYKDEIREGWRENRVYKLPTGEIVALFDDVTERKQAEEALKDSKEKYRTVLNSNPDPVIVYDMEGRVLYLNPAFTGVFGWTLEEQKGKNLDNFVPEENWPETRMMINTVTVLGESFSGLETRRYTKDGNILDISISGSCYRDREGNVAASVINLRDITEQRKIETQLQQAQKMEAIGTLASGVAHDFNNLLMAIQGRASTVLMNKDGSYPDFEHLRAIEDHVESAADLTNQLLGFAMGGKYEIKPTDLNELIEKQNQMFGRTKKEIIIKSKYQKDLWPVEIDRGQIDQVLLNLYVNAGQAMPGGGKLYLETENVILDKDYVKPFEIEPGRYVKISVTDTGVGMDKATQERIFDPFFTTKEMGRGTGLGLASVYGIIKNHRGFINVYSEKDNGSIFNIYLPASLKEVIEEEKLSGDTLMGFETVLFVDDEDMIIEVAEQLLTRLGYRVLTARSGKEAIKTYMENGQQIDIVILDMIMPEMGGGNTYDGLKMLNPKVKVLLSSGYSIDGQATEILDRGCNGFIQKPFKMKEFSQKLRDILDMG